MTGFPRAALPLAIALLTLLAFAPVLQNGFVDWDDDINLVRNDHFRGLGGPQLRWMFSTTLTGHYIPFTWLSFGLDYQVWGMRPVGYHLTSLLLHALGATLLAVLTARLVRHATGWNARAVTTASTVAALVFALHPLRVESVAWATERRDVLSGVFILVTVLAYVTAVDAGTSPWRRRWLLAGSVVAYVLALGSKSIAMALPVVLLALDAYPLRRTHVGWARLVREKLPFLVLAGVGAVVAFQAVAGAAVLTPLTQYPWPARVAMSAYSLVWTVEKIAMPLSLSPLYQLPVTLDPLSTRFAGRMAALVIITAALIALRRRWPAALVAWTCHAAFLLPVSGLLVHQGPQLVTDRYSYLPSLGWAVLAGAGAGWLVTAAERSVMGAGVSRFATAALAISLAALGFLSWHQSTVWHDTDTLWRHAIALDPECATCHANLGVHHMNVGDTGVAEIHLARAVALRPDRARYHANLGLFLVQQGRYADAVPELQGAVERVPNYVDALTGLGAALINLKRTAAALPFLERAVALRPDHVLAHTNLGAGLMEMDRPSEALEHYRRAVAADAAAPPPRAGLVRAYLALGRPDLAREQYGIVLRLDPRLARPLATAVLE